MAIIEHGSEVLRGTTRAREGFPRRKILEYIVLAEDVLVDPVEAAAYKDAFRAVDSMELDRGRIAIDVAL